MVRLSVAVSLSMILSQALGHEVDSSGERHLTGAYIFEFNNHDRLDFDSQIAANGRTRAELNYTLFQGASVQFTDLENSGRVAESIAKLPVVKRMWPVRVHKSVKPHVEWQGTPGQDYILSNEKRHAQSDGFAPHVMTQVDKLRQEGYTGQGIKIAVVDSGIDYKHPALGGCFGPNCLVSFGADLVGDDFNGENEFIYGDDPMDCQGHGTHVAGIISAQENPFHFTGAAPGVELGAYRVFGCQGGTSDDAVIAAFNQAYEDGADIITASLGGPRGWAESASALAISRIVDQGVPCLVAVGNSGSEGIFFPGGPADGKGVTAIASFDNIETFSLVNISSYSVNGSGNYQFGSSHAVPDGWHGVKLPLVAPSHDFNDNFGCEPYDDTTDLRGHIVLLSSGSCLATEKAGFAAAAGAEYIMMYSLDLGLTTINVPEVDGIKALATTTSDTGKEWMNLLKIGSKVTIDMGQRSDNNMILNKSPNKVTGGAVSTFSSWGPNWDMISKPQFGAPGSSILSTYPLSMGGYAILRGTSMACPLAAGIFALISEVRGTLEPSVLENILSSTSKPQLFHNGTSYHNILAPVPQQGAGIIQAYDAAHAQVVLSPSSLSFNDTDHFLGALNFTIANTGSEDIRLDITHMPALTVYTPKVKALDGGFPNEFTTKHSSLDFSESTVRVLSGENVTIEVLPTPPKDLQTEKLPVWSGYILLTLNNATVLSLPYLGLSGSLHESTVLGQHSGLIFNSDGKQTTIVPENTTFVLPKPGKVYGQDEAASLSATLPYLMHNLTLGSPELHAEIVPVAIQRLDSTALGVPRNGSIGQVSGFPKLWQSRQVETVPWSGGLSDGTYTPPGTYKIVYRALKIFGERQKRNDWEVAESQVFSIEYDS